VHVLDHIRAFSSWGQLSLPFQNWEWQWPGSCRTFRQPSIDLFYLFCHDLDLSLESFEEVRAIDFRLPLRKTLQILGPYKLH